MQYSLIAFTMYICLDKQNWFVVLLVKPLENHDKEVPTAE